MCIPCPGGKDGRLKQRATIKKLEGQSFFETLSLRFGCPMAADADTPEKERKPFRNSGDLKILCRIVTSTRLRQSVMKLHGSKERGI